MVWNKKAVTDALVKAEKDVDLTDVVQTKKTDWKKIEGDCPTAEASDDDRSWNSTSTEAYTYISYESRDSGDDNFSSFFDFTCDLFRGDASTVYTTASQRTEWTDETAMSAIRLDDDDEDAKTKASQVGVKKAQNAASTEQSVKATAKEEGSKVKLANSSLTPAQGKKEDAPLVKTRSETRRRSSGVGVKKQGDDQKEESNSSKAMSEFMNFLFFTNIPQLKKNYPLKQREAALQLETDNVWVPNRETLINARKVIKNPTSVDLKELHDLKGELKAELIAYDEDFMRANNRFPNADEKEPIREVYDYYYGIRSIILVEEKKTTSEREELSKKEAEFQKREQELLSKIEECRRDLDTVHLEVTLKDDNNVKAQGGAVGKKVAFAPNTRQKMMRPKSILRRKNKLFTRPTRENNNNISIASTATTSKDPSSSLPSEKIKESPSMILRKTADKEEVANGNAIDLCTEKVANKTAAVSTTEKTTKKEGLDDNSNTMDKLETDMNMMNQILDDVNTMNTNAMDINSSTIKESPPSLLKVVTENELAENEEISKPKKTRSFGGAFRMFSGKKIKKRSIQQSQKGGTNDEDDDNNDSVCSSDLDLESESESEDILRDTVLIYSRTRSSKR